MLHELLPFEAASRLSPRHCKRTRRVWAGNSCRTENATILLFFTGQTPRSIRLQYRSTKSWATTTKPSLKQFENSLNSRTASS